jgi:hypothetical protein
VRLKATLAVSLLAAVHFAVWGAAPTVAAERSENGLFSIDISSEVPDEILIAVQRQDRDVKTLEWSRKMPWKGFTPSAASSFRQYISNDGKAVILHDRRFNDERWLWLSQSAEARWFYTHNFSREIGVPLAQHKYSDPWFGGVSGALEFLSDQLNVFAIWYPAPNRWLTIDLKNGVLSSPNPSVIGILGSELGNVTRTDLWLTRPADEMVEALNDEDEAKRRSLDSIRMHQPNFLKAMLDPLRQKVGQFIPSVMPANASPLQSLYESYPFYLFVARNKVPEGEKYIHNLLEFPFHRKISSIDHSEPPCVTLRSDERALGDIALRLWNDIPVESDHHSSYRFPIQFRPGQYLGGVTGRIVLPIVRPDKDPGALWIYLVPASRGAGEWEKAEDVLPLYSNLSFGMHAGRLMARGGAFPFFPGPPPIEFDAVDFRFLTITPGKYRIKAVWDRRAPFAPMEGRAAPEPGDYESTESEPFDVAAGRILTIPPLECTNRISGVATYYTADEARKRIKPLPKGTIFQQPLPRDYFEFPAPPLTPLSRWSVATNAASPKISLKRIDVVQPQAEGSAFERKELFLTFEVIGSLEQKPRLSALVRDAHKCTFDATVSVTPMRGAPREVTVRVPVFPRNYQFQVELRSAESDAVICSYMLKNAGPAESTEFKARALPITRKLATQSIRLEALSRGEGARFSLVAGNEASPCRPESVIYEDSEGNRSLDPADFCREERFLKVRVLHESARCEFIAALAD